MYLNNKHLQSYAKFAKTITLLYSTKIVIFLLRLNIFFSSVVITIDGQTYSYADLFGELKDGMAKLAEPLPQPNNTANENNYTDARHVEVTVNIENAVTQDNEGIRLLADRVADRIQPAVVNALGGDSNSYSNR